MAELAELGATRQRETVAGVYFDGDLSIAYRVCLWSRLANKVLLPLTGFDVSSQEDLYVGAKAIVWEEYLGPQTTILLDFIGCIGVIRNSQFGAVLIIVYNGDTEMEKK